MPRRTQTQRTKDLEAIRSIIAPIAVLEGFKPTEKQIKFSIAYGDLLEKQGNGEVIEYVTTAELSHKGLGNDQSLYYKWRKNPNFEKWLNLVANDFFKGSGLRQVRSSMHRRACQNSPQDAKLYLELNDPSYKPSSTVEHQVSGLRPPDAATEQAAITASRKLIESNTKDSPCL